MTPQDLIAAFDVLADAPDGVKRLRELVLSLAVRGKLVAQDPGDGAALTNLGPVREEKGPLLKARVRGRPKVPRIPEAWECEHELPAGWEWARLDDTGEYINGLAFKPKDWHDDGLPIIRIQNLTDPNKPFNYARGEFPEDRLIHDGDILVSWSATLDAFVWNRGDAVLNQHIFKVVPDERVVDKDYLFHLCRHTIAEMADSEKAHGLVMKHINRGPFLSHVVMLPPLPEQRRIVARVDELMALLDRLEADRAARDDLRTAARDAALAELRDAPDAEAAEAAWGRIARNMDALFATPEDVAPLRQAILGLAVRGRLVEQDPRDEPARALLQHLGVACEAIIEAPFELPQSWCWARFDAVAEIASNLVDPSNHPAAPHVAPNNIEKNTGRLLAYQTVYADGVRSGKHRFFAGQILYSKIRPNLCKAVKVDFDGLCSADMYPINPRIDRGYLHVYILSHPFFEQVTADDNRLAMPKVNKQQLSAVTVSVPPLPEQQRIVEKVDALMALCEDLEARLTAARDLHGQFAAAAVHHLDT